MKIRNRELLKRKLLAMPAAARRELHIALDAAAADMRDTARLLVPKRSGALFRSINYTFGKYQVANANVRGFSSGRRGVLNADDLSVTIHAGDEHAYYAAFVEFGTAPHKAKGRMRGTINPGTQAQPFFFPAWRLSKRRVRGRITRAYRKAVLAVVGAGQ